MATLQNPTTKEIKTVDDNSSMIQAYNNQGFVPVSADTSAIAVDSIQPAKPITVAPVTTPAIPDVAEITKTATVTTPDLAPTEQETQQSDLTKRIQSLNDQLAGRAAFQTEQEKKAGIADLSKTQNDLTAQLNAINLESKSLTNQANLIPSQIQEQSVGRGRTAGGVAPLTAGELRKNQLAQGALASRALTVSANLEAIKGNLATAQNLVKQAVDAEFAPKEAQRDALLQNLQLIKDDPLTSLQDKNRAQKQIDIQKKQAEADATAKENKITIFNLATEAARNGADALTLQKIQQAGTPEEALRIASEAGIALKTEAEKKAIQDELTLKGYTLLKPSQLAGLSENQILRMSNGDIYKKPVEAETFTTKNITVGSGNSAKDYLITYDNTGREVKREILGGGGGVARTTGTAKKTTANSELNDATNAMTEQLSTVTGADGYISPENYTIARKAWVDAGLNPTTFDTRFAGFRNPNNPYYVTSKTTTKKQTSNSQLP